MASMMAPPGPESHVKTLDAVQTHSVKADLDYRRVCGKALGKALSLLGWSQKQAAIEIAQASRREKFDEATLSRWLSGAEEMKLSMLIAVEELRQPLLEAFARLSGADVQVQVTFRRVG